MCEQSTQNTEVRALSWVPGSGSGFVLLAINPCNSRMTVNYDEVFASNIITTVNAKGEKEKRSKTQPLENERC